MKSKIKFTKASKKDGNLVTVSLIALDKGDVVVGNADPTYLCQGEEFILEVNGIPTLFQVNREGRTATTKSFPRKIRLPSVGRPMFANVFLCAALISRS